MRLLLLVFLTLATDAARADDTASNGFLFDASDALIETQLRRFTGTASARRDVTEALERLERHRPMVERAFKKHGVPLELVAIPVVESRYRNLPERANYLRCCAGMWQLHRITAGAYGLRIAGDVDERKDVQKATEVAARHLADLYERFGDWSLAVAAWNVGATRIQRLRRTTGLDCAWELARAGHIGPFLSRVAAVTRILGEPLLLTGGERPEKIVPAAGTPTTAGL